VSDRCVTPVLVLFPSAADTPWPWPGPRPNPAPSGYRLRPRWQPLRPSGTYNEAVRIALAGMSGVYAVRRVGDPRPMYVGMSEAGATGKYLARMWKTILRHLQPGSGKFKHARAMWGRPTEWVYSGTDDLEIALWSAPPGETYALESRLIGKLEPTDLPSGLPEVPF